jgi:hypothetical protein
MHFGENQLSPSLIGLSPLPTAHPPGLQPWWVRASTRSYPRFTLAMGRSLGFGSAPRDSTPTSDSLSLRLPHTGLTSPRNATRRLILQKARHHPQKALTDCRHTVSGTISLPSRGTFHHSLTVLSTIGHQEVFRLTRWAWQIHTEFHGYRATREPPQKTHVIFTYGTLTHSGRPSQAVQLTTQTPRRVSSPSQGGPTTPDTQRLPALPRIRFSPHPVSLATTPGITIVFSSYGY